MNIAFPLWRKNKWGSNLIPFDFGISLIFKTEALRAQSTVCVKRFPEDI
jgi:hypothetical protein